MFPDKGTPVNDIRTGLKKGCKKAGIEYGSYEDFSVHTLRLTSRTDCLRKGIPDNVSEAIMGHSEGNIMSKRYDDITDHGKLHAVSHWKNIAQVLAKTLAKRQLDESSTQGKLFKLLQMREWRNW